MSLTTFLPKWNHLAIAVAVVFVCVDASAQTRTQGQTTGTTQDRPQTVVTTRSNIRHGAGVMATYSSKDGLTLTFNPAAMDAADKAELAKGYFIATDDIKLTAAECKELGATVGTMILKGKYKIEQGGNGTAHVTLRRDGGLSWDTSTK